MSNIMVQAGEMSWTLAPIPRLEDADVLALTTGELLEYAADLQAEAQSLRRVMHEALAVIARQQDELARAARVIDQQRRELRASRKDAAA